MLQLLALFDDVPALSQLENNILDPSYFELSLYEETRSVRVDDRREKKMDDRREKKMDDRQKDREEKNEVFAVPTVYGCMYCLKRFYSRTASRRHQVCHAKEQLRCPCCRTRSYSIGAVRRHFEYFHHCTRRRQILIETQWPRIPEDNSSTIVTTRAFVRYKIFLSRFHERFCRINRYFFEVMSKFYSAGGISCGCIEVVSILWDYIEAISVFWGYLEAIGIF